MLVSDYRCIARINVAPVLFGLYFLVHWRCWRPEHAQRRNHRTGLALCLSRTWYIADVGRTAMKPDCGRYIDHVSVVSSWSALRILKKRDLRCGDDLLAALRVWWNDTLTRMPLLITSPRAPPRAKVVRKSRRMTYLSDIPIHDR